MNKKINDIYYKLKDYIRSIIQRFKKVEGIYDFESLTPTQDADKDGAYANAIKYALEKKDIKNIAVSGPFGSGKSSVIKSFFSKAKNKKYKHIYVSLAAFNNNDDFSSESPNNKANEFYRAIEKSILQQIMYQAKESELPLSRFKRLSKHSKQLLILESDGLT